MKKIIGILFFAIGILTIISCSKSISVKHVDSSTKMPESDGFYYSLPKTAITVEADISKTYKIKGPYSDFADKFLGLTNIIKENTETYALENIEISSYSIPDPDQYYFVEVPKACHHKNSILLQLSESGIISSINDFSRTNIQADPSDPAASVSDDQSEPPVQTFVNLNLTEAFDTIIEKINMDSVTLQKKTVKKVYVEKTVEQKAKDAADIIMRIKENMFNLLTGYAEVNYSKEAIAYMTEQLEKMESEYMDLFTGIAVTHHYKYYFTYVPVDTGNRTYLPLFRFSPKEGIVDTSGYYGESVYLRIDKTSDTKAIKTFNDSKQNIKRKESGFFYRIPEYAKVSVYYQDKEKAEKSILIDQFGMVDELPADKLKATYYPNSGSLKTISVNKRGHHPWHH